MNFRLFTIFLLKISLFFGFFSSLSHAKPQKSKSDKTRITSNYIDIKRKSQEITFIDNVVVKNGPDMMTSDKMIVFYKENKNSKKSNSVEENSSIEKIVSNGNVKLFSSEFVASSDSGYYNPDQSVFILEKNVVVNNGDSIGTGDKFTYSLKTRKGDFVGGKKNVDGDSRVIFIIDKDAKTKSENKK